jgi:transposase
VIQITPQMKVLVAVDPVDFRKGIDGLCRVARDELSGDPWSGRVFVFRNRRRTAVKLLVYDGQGFWLAQKRLSAGKFRHWPSGPPKTGRALEAHAVQVLLWAGDFEAARMAPTWRPLESAAP